MKIRSIVLLAFIAIGAVAIVTLTRSQRVSPSNVIARTGDDAQSATVESAPSASAVAAPTRPSGEAGWRTPSSPSPSYAQPDEIERQIEQFFAEQSGLALVSLSSIECGATACEIALAGTEVNPRTVDALDGLFQRLTVRRESFRVLSGGLGTREIAPGAREYVITLEYQPFVDLSPDPLIAARQYAACAAAWRRQTENPTPADVARQYLEQADRYVGLAASVLGEDEAARIAAETRGGPLIRTCGL